MMRRILAGFDPGRRRLLAGVAVATSLPAGAQAFAASPASEPSRAVERWQVGVNLSALEDGATVPGIANQDFALPTDAELDFIRRKRLNPVRLPFKWERMQPALSGRLDAQYLGYLRAAVAKAGARGLTVILDCHNYGGFGGRKIGSEKVTFAQFADLWFRLASVFKDDPAVAAYDLMNEPSNMPKADSWQHAAQAAIDAVRSVDKKKVILVEGNNFSSAFTWVRENPALHLLRDPAHRLVFSAHAYLDRDNSGTHYAWQEEVAAADQVAGLPLDSSIGVRRVAGFVGWLQAHQLAGNVGETGAGSDDPDWLRALDLEIAYLLEHGVSFIYWNLGPFFRTYPYSIEPDGTGVDKVQVAVLTKYTKAAQPDTYSVTAERKGSTGRPCYAISISYQGLIAAPITFLLDDGESGGTFSSGAVKMPQGFNGRETVLYVPHNAAAATIRFHNSSGLRDPAALQLDPWYKRRQFNGWRSTWQAVRAAQRQDVSAAGGKLAPAAPSPDLARKECASLPPSAELVGIHDQNNQRAGDNPLPK